MRKLLRFVLVSVMLLTSGMSFAQAYKTLTFPDDDKDKNKVAAYCVKEKDGSFTDLVWTARIGADTWSITNFNNNNWNSWAFIKCGTKNTANVACIATDFAIDKAIDNVCVTIDKVTVASCANSIKLIVASDKDFKNVTENVEIDATKVEAGNMIFKIANPKSNQYYKIAYDMKKASSNGPIQISKVQYNEAGATILEPANISFSKLAFTVNLGETVELPTFNNPNNLAVTFDSSDKSVATIDANGNVTVLAAGETQITAKSAKTDKYDAGYAYYNLTVKGGQVVADEVTLPYEEAFKSNIGSFKIDDVNLGEGLTFVWKHNTSNGGYMKGSGYNKKNIASESWLVSPVINMKNIEKATLAFEHCINNYFGDAAKEATLWIKEEGGSWNQLALTHPTVQSTGWSNWGDGKVSIDITSYAGKKIQVGFKYISSDSAAGAWEIRNFSVTGTTTGINGVQAEQANDGVTYNLAGQRVSSSYKGAVIRNGVKFIQK